MKVLEIRIVRRWFVNIPDDMHSDDWMSYHTADDIEEHGDLSGDDPEMRLLSVEDAD